MTLLFVVEERFQISGRGCVLAPGASTEPGSPIVKVGDPLRLKTPDGRVIDTRVLGIEMLNFRRIPVRITAPILLPPELSAEDVPSGTEVYLMKGHGKVGGRDA